MTSGCQVPVPGKGWRLVPCGAPWVGWLRHRRVCEKHLPAEVRVARIDWRTSKRKAADA